MYFLLKNREGRRNKVGLYQLENLENSRLLQVGYLQDTAAWSKYFKGQTDGHAGK